MDIKPIKSEQDYLDALQRIDVLWGCKKDTPEGDEFELLVTLVESYEMKHYAIAPPDPVVAIKFRVKQMNMTNAGIIKQLLEEESKIVSDESMKVLSEFENTEPRTLNPKP